MNNVYSIITRRPIHPGNRITTGTRTDNFARKVIERVHQIAVKPAWVTGCAVLNRAITELEKKGWCIECFGDGEIRCRHPQLQTAHRDWVYLSKAQELQRILDGKHN